MQAAISLHDESPDHWKVNENHQFDEKEAVCFLSDLCRRWRRHKRPHQKKTQRTQGPVISATSQISQRAPKYWNDPITGYFQLPMRQREPTTVHSAKCFCLLKSRHISSGALETRHYFPPTRFFNTSGTRIVRFAVLSPKLVSQVRCFSSFIFFLLNVTILSH